MVAERSLKPNASLRWPNCSQRRHRPASTRWPDRCTGPTSRPARPIKSGTLYEPGSNISWRGSRHLDHHVIPRCWFRHNGHVEALVALRDQERVNYSDTAPGSAAVEWHRALRDIEARLREWTGQLACGATHEVRAHQVRSLDSDEWDQFVNDDVNRRDTQAVASTLAE